MINIVNTKARRLYQQEFNREMTILENTFYKELRPLLGRQFFNASNLVEHGVELEGVSHAVDLGRDRLIELFQKHYKRVTASFGRKTYKIFENAKKNIVVPELKSPKDEFWMAMNKWASTQSAQKIRGLQDTTKSNIAKIIQKGQQEGESSREIAKRIRVTSAQINPHRARTIALTETHTAAVKSVDAAVASTRIEMEREWVSAKDMRTRTRGLKSRFDHYHKYPLGADGERVAQDGIFVGSGESMKFPGDPSGSAGNVVRCRCVLLYHAVNRMEELKPYVPEGIDFVPPDDETVQAIKEWTGVADSKLSFEDFRKGNDPKAIKLRNFVKQPGDSIINQPHFRGMALTEKQLSDFKVGGFIELESITSFSRSEKIAEGISKGLAKILESFGIDDARAIIIKTDRLAAGVDISKYAEALKGQQETLSFGRLKIQSIKRKGDLVEIKAIHDIKLPGVVKPKVEGVLGRITAGKPAKSAKEILEHYEASSKATYKGGLSASDMKMDIEQKLGTKFFEAKFGSGADDFVRFITNASITDVPEMVEGHYQWATGKIIQQWAATSGDSNPRSIMMQLAAKAEFKLEGTTLWWEKAALKEAEELFKIHGDSARKFLRLMYEDTQEHLKKLGLKTVRVARGFKGEVDDVLSTVEKPLLKTKIELQPMSSFSSNFDIAEDFSARSELKNMFFAEVPADRILSTPVTGYGCKDEFEFVVLGSQKKGEIMLTGSLGKGNYFLPIFDPKRESLANGIVNALHKVTK
jgi:hypothetical protein